VKARRTGSLRRGDRVHSLDLAGYRSSQPREHAMQGNHRAAAEAGVAAGPGAMRRLWRGVGPRARHRHLEAAALVAVPVLASLLLADVWSRSGAVWTLLFALVAAHPAADLVSGLVHWAADRILPIGAPYLGPAFVRPFREHHADPRGITRHDFIETNGNTCIALAPALAGVWWWATGRPGTPATVLVEALAVGLAFWLCVTNQIHKWAHLERPPAAVRLLQRCRLILEPRHHAAHHRPPFDRRFCITSGWLNPVVDRLGMFDRLERCCRPRAALPPPQPPADRR
jgi:ubiquitin-conjugating enzyme E2 variant